ncbi:MAG: helix-turn-helix transcriptional regulator [Bacteroidales bacterium]|nr:helix-turn-helix transcriptional regulator [Bacteroidales bacterium]
MKSISKELMGAASIPLILAVLKRGDNYGYEIVQEVKKLTNEKVNWKEASIYPVLKKMENSGMIKSYWKMEENQRPRRYYTILADGKKQLENNMVEWDLIHSALEKLMGMSGG